MGPPEVPASKKKTKKNERNAAASDSDVILILQPFLRPYTLLQTWSFSKTPSFGGACLKRQLGAASLSCRRNLRSSSTAEPGVNEPGERNERLVPPSVLRRNKKWHFLFVLPVCLIPGNADNQQGRGVKCIINLPRGSHLALGAHPDAAAATLGYVRRKVL